MATDLTQAHHERKVPCAMVTDGEPSMMTGPIGAVLNEGGLA